MNDRTRPGDLLETSSSAESLRYARDRRETRAALAVFRAIHRLYKALASPLLGNRCRFFPSCSDYALEAVERYGILHGGRLAIGRLCRCHPLSAGGFDPPPRASGASDVEPPARRSETHEVRTHF